MLHAHLIGRWRGLGGRYSTRVLKSNRHTHIAACLGDHTIRYKLHILIHQTINRASHTYVCVREMGECVWWCGDY